MRGKVLVAQGVLGGSFYEKLLESSSVSDGAKTDLPLAKAEPVSDAGSASGMTYLRRGGGWNPAAAAGEERSENT